MNINKKYSLLKIIKTKKNKKDKKINNSSLKTSCNNKKNNNYNNFDIFDNSNNLNKSNYLKKNLSKYNNFKNLLNIKIPSFKKILKTYWCFICIISIIISSIFIHSYTNYKIDQLNKDTISLLKLVKKENKKLEKLKKENDDLIKKQADLNSNDEALKEKISNNEQLLDEYINQINDLNNQISQKTSWMIPTIALNVPIDDSFFKTYMDFRKITNQSSKQYKLLHSDKVKYDEDGLIRSTDDYIGVALGSKYGDIGDKFILSLKKSDGSISEVKLLKVESKADKDTTDGYYASHKDIVELVIDVDKAQKSYPAAIFTGDFNYSNLFNGQVVAIKKVIQ